MRTNSASLALSVGMGLIVLLMGFVLLSAAGLVKFESAPVEEVATEPGNKPTPASAPQPAAPLSAAETAAVSAGDALFKNNCAQCHAVNDKVVGPALAGISKRRSISWLVPWVHNSSKVIASGDEYAVKLFNDNGKQQMPAFPQLSDTDIKNIVAWVTSQEGGVSASAVVVN